MTLLGIIVLIASQAFAQAMRVIPESGERTRAATAREEFLHRFGDQIGRSQAIRFGDGSATGTQQTRCQESNGSRHIATFVWTDYAANTSNGYGVYDYRYTFFDFNAIGNGTVEVWLYQQRVRDWYGSPTSAGRGTERSIFLGYCRPREVIAEITFARRPAGGIDATLDLTLADTRRSEATTVRFRASTRADSCPFGSGQFCTLRP